MNICIIIIIFEMILLLIGRLKFCVEFFWRFSRISFIFRFNILMMLLVYGKLFVWSERRFIWLLIVRFWVNLSVMKLI